MAPTPRAAGAPATRRDLVDVVEDLLPSWRAHRPHRTRAAAWPTRAARVGGRDVELFSLPQVGTTWFARNGGYWWRRMSRAVLMAIAVLAQTAFDVGALAAAWDARPVSVVVVVVVVIIVVLAVAASLLYWRPDLLAARRSGVASPLPMSLRWVLATVGLVGAIATPLYSLGLFLDLLPRFPVQERVAWDFLVGQLGSSDAAAGSVNPG